MILTAKLDRRKLMIYALGLFVIGNIISFLVQGFGLFAGARVIMALGAGTVVVTALTIAAKSLPGKTGKFSRNRHYGVYGGAHYRCSDRKNRV